MRWSQSFLVTLREVPGDAEVVSHQLLYRAGMMQKLMNRYIVRLQRSAAQDASLSTAFLTAANLLAKPSRLFAPSVVWAVAKGAWFTRHERPKHAVPPRQLTWDPSGNG